MNKSFLLLAALLLVGNCVVASDDGSLEGSMSVGSRECLPEVAFVKGDCFIAWCSESALAEDASIFREIKAAAEGTEAITKEQVELWYQQIGNSNDTAKYALAVNSQGKLLVRCSAGVEVIGKKDGDKKYSWQAELPEVSISDGWSHFVIATRFGGLSRSTPVFLAGYLDEFDNKVDWMIGMTRPTGNLVFVHTPFSL